MFRFNNLRSEWEGSNAKKSLTSHD